MKLSDLDPHLMKRGDDTHWQQVATLAEADGLQFLCPKCWEANQGPKGTHSVLCWSPKVPQTTSPTPGRWDMKGTGIADLTLVAGSSSVALQGGCKAHFFIRNGEIINA